MKKKLSNSIATTKKLGALCSRAVTKAKRNHSSKKAIIIALDGELGSGKTTFVQGFLKELGVRGKVTSPTFIIFRRYKSIYHIDAYRVRNPKEILNLGFAEMIKNPKNTILIEWPENIKSILPTSTIWIRFSHGEKENERTLSL